MCKIQLAITINSISSKDVDEEHAMHSTSENIKFMLYENENKVVDELFESLFWYKKLVEKYQWVGKIFNFGSAQILYCKCHKIDFKRNGSYIDSLEWIKKEKSNNKPKK